MYTIFTCRKCGHNLYVEETEDFGKKLEDIQLMECPNCGEDNEENWILGQRAKTFKGD